MAFANAQSLSFVACLSYKEPNINVIYRSYDDPNIYFDDDSIIGSYVDPYDISYVRYGAGFDVGSVDKPCNNPFIGSYVDRYDWCNVGFAAGLGNWLSVGSYDDPWI